MPPKQTNKRKIYCKCCKSLVTTETFKDHLRAQAGLPRPTKPKRTHGKLRHYLRRLSSRESINAHRYQSLRTSPNPPDLSNQPSQQIDMEFEDDMLAIPKVQMDNIWEQVMETRAATLVDLPNQLSSTISHVTTRSSQASNETPSSIWSSDSDHDVEFHPGTYGLGPGANIRKRLLVDVAKNAPRTLAPDSRDTIMDFDFFVKQKTGVRTHEAMRKTYCRRSTQTTIPSLKEIRRQMLALSALRPVEYHCCQNSCICYTGYLKEFTDCPYCHSPRLNPAGAPYAVFSYIPLIPQLLALFRNPTTYDKLLYRSQHRKNDETIKDVFDAFLYEFLCETQVSVDGKKLPFKHFEDFRELALMIMLDGMAPFKKRKHSCWPIIIINFNLKPEIRMHQDNIICIGAIPGPHSPKDINSFLQPLIDELAELAKGVEAVDVVRGELFALRAHLIAAGGDIPAISKLLELLGHNARFPCRLCTIQSVPGRTVKNSSHLYCPLHRPDGNSIDPLDLPLRTHDETIKQGYEVLRAPNEHARSKLATKYGVKGVTLLARLSSIRIPDSFPVEVMHMVWINLVPQLMDLWQGKFQELDSGIERYNLDTLLVNLLGNLCHESGSTFPSDFGCRVPHFKNQSHFTAESWSVWALHYAPHYLRRRFRNSKYYIHFVRLIKLLNEITGYKIERSELPRIRREIAEWIQDFELIYYQHDADRVRVCTTNIHYLLHVVDSIERMGPVCVYWSYPMERYCSFVGAAVKSRRFPYANIARRLLDVAQLRTVREIYDLHDSISFGQTRASTEGNNAAELAQADRVPGKEYKDILLLTPRTEPLVVTVPLRNQINKYLATAFGVTIGKKESEKIVPASVKQWGRMRIANGGDLIHARGYHKLRSDGRDASFVRYQQMVDQLAHRRRAKEVLKEQSFYGQVRHIFQLNLPPRSIVNAAEDPRPLLLALIYEAPVTREETYEYPVVWYEGDLSTGEVVDASTIACAVGRLKDNKRWWIVDRSSGAGDVEFI